MNGIAKQALGGLLWMAAMTAAGCRQEYQSAAADVDPADWHEPAEVTIGNADTTTLRDIALFLRCNDRFAEDTLTVRIETLSPDSLRFAESFLLPIPYAASPAALAREVRIPYRHRAIFDRTGDYRIRIAPCRSVRGVEAVGVDIVRHP